MNQKILKELIKFLDSTPNSITELLMALPDEFIYANEGDNTWSPYDIIGHLLHGEKTDWIPRTKIILEFGETKPFKPFDRFAQEKDSEGRTIKDLINQFSTLRVRNIAELTEMNLTDEDFKKTGIHPEFGKVTLSQLLTTWVVHDLNHITQITRVISKQFKNEIGPWKKYLRIVNN